jgi:hypothetical protein
MKPYTPSRPWVLPALALVLGFSATANAEQFIGFGQPGIPGKWALESFPVFNRTVDGNVRAGGNTVLAYFSETGFTGTTRDQLQFWVGAIPGYASTNGARDTSPWGIASPNLGFAYYYNVVEPTSDYGSADFTTFWTNPTLMVEFPNGVFGLAFNLEEMEYLDFFEYKGTDADTRGWRRIHVTNGEHPYMNRFWVPGLVIGYEHTFLNALADFVAGIESGVPAEPTFRTGLQTQKVCEAVLKSGKTGAWEETGVEL